MKIALRLPFHFRRPSVRLRAKIFAIAGVTLVAMSAITSIFYYQNVQIDAAARAEREASRTLATIAIATSIAESLRSDVSGLVVSPSPALIERVDLALRRLEQFVEAHPEEETLNLALRELPAFAKVISDATSEIGLGQQSGLTFAVEA